MKYSITGVRLTVVYHREHLYMQRMMLRPLKIVFAQLALIKTHMGK